MVATNGSTHFHAKKSKSERYWVAPVDIFTAGANAVLGIKGLSKGTQAIFDQGRIYSPEQATELLPLIERFKAQADGLSQKAEILTSYLTSLIKPTESE